MCLKNARARHSGCDFFRRMSYSRHCISANDILSPLYSRHSAKLLTFVAVVPAVVVVGAVASIAVADTSTVAVAAAAAAVAVGDARSLAIIC